MDSKENIPGSSETVTAGTGQNAVEINRDLAIELSVSPHINFAVQQNRIPLIKSITVFNKSTVDLRDLTLKIHASPAFAEPSFIHLDIVPALERVTVNDANVHLNPEYLVNINEKVTGRIDIELIDAAETVIQQKSENIDVRAYDEWLGTTQYPELLASYIMPNHPVYGSVISDGADILKDWGLDNQFDGYLSEDPNRVLQMGAAIYEALRKRNMLYVVSKSGYSLIGQRIRLCDQVLSQKQGNCLDLSLLYAGALEAVGINPLLILTSDHAFVGFWLEQKNFPNVVQDDASNITKRIADGINEIAIVEATALLSNCDFKKSQSMALQNLKNLDAVEYIIDIKCARSYGYSPLPLRIKSDDGWTIERPEIKDTGSTSPDRLSDTVVLSSEATELTKKQVWERKLLDLGLRNSLISMRLNKVLIPVLCNSVDQFEDNLADGESFVILPRPEEIDFKNEDISFDTLHNLPQFKDIVDQDFKNKRLRSVLTDAVLKDKLKELFRAAKVSLEENGTNTLYLALGLLKWYENERSTKARYAPIVLLPVEIIRKSAVSGFTLRLRDDDPMMNFTILEKIKQDFKIEINGLDPLPSDEHGIDLRLVLNIVRKAIVDQPRWDVLESGYIGIFSFTQFVMWNDIRNRSEDLSRNKIVKSLIDGKLSWDSNFTNIPEEVDESSAILPISADASQLYAINAAANGESFVLHGPPGTGKSQTITGLIGNALGKGKTVLFVAEKMAALSVVEKRLSKIGLGAFCLEIHSNKAKKSSILEQLQQTLELAKENGRSIYTEKADQLAKIRSDLACYVRALKKIQPCGYSTYELLNLYEQNIDLETSLTFPADFVKSLTKEKLAELEKVIQELVAMGRELGEISDHPLALISGGNYSEQLRTELPHELDSYAESFNEMENTFKEVNRQFNQPVDNYEDLTGLAEIIRSANVLTSSPKQWYSSANRSRILSDLIDLTDLYTNAQKVKADLHKDWKDELFEQDSSQLRSEYDSVMSKWFLPRFFASRKLTQKYMGYFKGSDFTSVDISQLISKLEKCDSDCDKAYTLLKEQSEDLGELYEGRKTDLAKLNNSAKEVQEILRKFNSMKLNFAALAEDDFATNCANAEKAWNRYLEKFDSLDQKLELTRDNTAGNWFDANHSMLSFLDSHPEILREWMLFNNSRKHAVELGLKPLIDLYMTELSNDEVLDHYRHAVYQALVTLAIDGSDELKNFSSARFNEQIRMFRSMSEQVQKLAQQEIYFRLLAQLPDPNIDGAKSSELGILQRAIRNKGRGLTIRKLFEQIPNLLPKLCPCMLMSPISVAQYLDPNREPFDLVVFDEASQLPTRKAVGAIARGSNAVIVGDPKQMPPTSFFMSGNEDEDNLEMEDLESILDDALAINLPQSHLLWHYRSRHESLIAFSNQQFYGNDLYTFPSTNDRESLVTMRRVDGYFERGGKRTNRGEAEAIVEEIIARCKDPVRRKQSLGVVTFNISQQNLIDDLLLEACKKDPDLDEWINTSEEPLFIKNLENVQGDERDVIFFSIAYGKDREGKMTMNFGPLNRDGGWRRLNVAVTRARQEMRIFSSIGYEDIDLNRTAAEGVKALRNFLEYAEHGRLAMDKNRASQFAGRRDYIAANIERMLVDLGYKVDRNIGKSKFNIDLAVLDPNDPNKYILGILLDGYSYQQAHSVWDREVSQISVLQGLGWYITRVWSLDWKNNRQKEINRLLELLTALQDPEQKAKLMESAKPRPVEVPPPVTSADPGSGSVAGTVINSRRTAVEAPVVPARNLAVVNDPYQDVDLAKELRHPRDILSDSLLTSKFDEPLVQKANRLIEVAAPMSRTLLHKILLECYGISRTNKKLEAKLGGEIAIRINAVKVRDTVNGELYYWKRSQDPNTYNTYRTGYYGLTRNGTDVASQEVTAAIMTVVKNMVGISSGELIKETSKILGIKRSNKNSNEYFQMVLDKLIAQKKITINDSGNCMINKD